MNQESKNAAYWRERSEAVEASNNRAVKTTVADIDQMFQEAQREIERDIATWYSRFAKNNDIDLAEAKRLLNSQELEEFRWNIQKYISHARKNTVSGAWTRQLENASARYHISRLEALKIQNQHTLEKLFGNQLDMMDDLFRKQYTESYHKTLFEIQRGFNIGWDVAPIDQRKLSRLLQKPWTLDGRTFKTRTDDNREQMIDTLQKEMVQGLLRGAPPNEIIKRIESRFKTFGYGAKRIVMTESSYFASLGQQEVYKELDVEEFEILVTLDCRTCEDCGKFDGEVIRVTDFQAGVTAPPYHPFCRCTTIPHFPNDMGKRIARDKEGKTTYIPNTMKYSEWKKTFVSKETSVGSTGSTTIKESPEVKQMLASLNNPTLNDPASRKAFAEKIIDNMGIDRTNIDVTVEFHKDARGYCAFASTSTDAKLIYDKFNLQRQDNRSIEYQMKTTFHEAFHLKANGQPTDIHSLFKQGDREKWVTIEDTFAEVAAHYAAKVHGINDKLHPAYAEHLVRVLPRLKQTSEFSTCTTFADFGKIVLDKRLKGSSSEWGSFYDNLFSKSFDDDAYFLKYLPHIESNKDGLLEKFFENDPDLKIYKNQMNGEIDNVIDKIKNGRNYTTLTGNGEMLIRNLFVAAMNEKGVM